MRWSEDFGYYLQDTKGAFFGIGDGEEHAQLHTEHFEFPDAELVNREDDMGLEGLRKSKMSYNPIYLEEKYEIRQK